MAKPIVPAPQATHAVLGLLLAVPAGQTVHAPCPATEMKLFAHGVQSPVMARFVSWSIQNVPAGQVWHCTRSVFRFERSVFRFERSVFRFEVEITFFFVPDGHWKV